MEKVRRMNLHLRIQHAALLLATASALATGHGMTRGLLPGTGFGSWYQYHRWSGLAAALVIGYHVVYLFVRGYVEGLSWVDFPVAPRRPDWRGLREEIGFIAGPGASRPEGDFFRVSQKALYWGVGLLLAGLVVSGIFVSYWERFSLPGGIPLLGTLSQVHRGVGLLLLGALLWHVYGSFFWSGRFCPQWSWLTGSMPAWLAEAKVPGFYREQLRREAELKAARSRKSAEELAQEEESLERENVEHDLEEGNRLAKEEKFVEALYHYRRALERYPGYSQARYNMAVVLRKMGERAMAVENFRQFLKDDPFHPLARKAQEYIAELGEEIR